MKIRSMKLREAHKNNGVSSYCTILWDLTAEHIVTASSSDASISIHDALLPSNTPRFLRNHRDGVTTLALSPNSSCLASGSSDRSVKLYKFPGNLFPLLFFLFLYARGLPIYRLLLMLVYKQFGLISVDCRF